MKANVPQYVLKDSKYSSFFNKVSETVLSLRAWAFILLKHFIAIFSDAVNWDAEKPNAARELRSEQQQV